MIAYIISLNNISDALFACHFLVLSATFHPFQMAIIRYQSVNIRQQNVWGFIDYLDLNGYCGEFEVDWGIEQFFRREEINL